MRRAHLPSRKYPLVGLCARVSLLVGLLSIAGIALGADTLQRRYITLEECVALARNHSAQALVAKHTLRAAYWQYRSYRAEFLPSLKLTGSLPEFNRRIVRYQREDGSYTYVAENSNTMGLGLSLTQRIGLTGTSLFVKSSAERVDLFGNNRRTNYMTVPVQAGLQHDFFAVNELKWSSRIEPKKFQRAKLQYIAQLERISAEATQLFFDLLIAKQSVDIARLNLANADTLYQIAKGRYNIGTIAQNELLQMELNFLNAGHSLNEAEVQLQLYKFKLISYLGLVPDLDWIPVEPIRPTVAEVKYDRVLALANERNPQLIGFEIDQIEAKKGIASARADMGFQANVQLTYGLTQQAETLTDSYKSPMDQQGVRLTVGIPILDWGRGKGKLQMARSSYEIAKVQAAQSLEEFTQNVYLQVMRYSLLPAQLELAAKADTIAQNRYRITKERFLIGKVDVLELDKAQVDRDAARVAYTRSLLSYWQTYYALRQLALYDPNTDRELDIEPELNGLVR